MKKMLCALLLLMIPLLTACVSREQADAKLALGCAAGAELFLEEGRSIKEITKRTYGHSPEMGSGYREVRLEVVETDGWAENPQEYSCIFAEDYALFGLSHAATIYQLKMHDKTFGKEGDEIIGTFDDMLKLTETVEQGMNRP